MFYVKFSTADNAAADLFVDSGAKYGCLKDLKSAGVC
mgnify:CR=1 FL=1